MQPTPRLSAPDQSILERAADPEFDAKFAALIEGLGYLMKVKVGAHRA